MCGLQGNQYSSFHFSCNRVIKLTGFTPSKMPSLTLLCLTSSYLGSHFWPNLPNWSTKLRHAMPMKSVSCLCILSAYPLTPPLISLHQALLTVLLQCLSHMFSVCIMLQLFFTSDAHIHFGSFWSLTVKSCPFFHLSMIWPPHIISL